MRCRSARFVSLILALSLMPGAFEVIENAGHLIREGHLAHVAAAVEDHHEPLGPEHGCTLVFHLCACHASLAFLGPERPPALVLDDAGSFHQPAAAPARVGFRLPLDHPPQV